MRSIAGTEPGILMPFRPRRFRTGGKKGRNVEGSALKHPLGESFRPGPRHLRNRGIKNDPPTRRCRNGRVIHRARYSVSLSPLVGCQTRAGIAIRNMRRQGRNKLNYFHILLHLQPFCPAVNLFLAGKGSICVAHKPRKRITSFGLRRGTQLHQAYHTA